MDQRDNTFYYGGTPCFNAEPCPLDSVQQHVASAVVGLHGVPSVSSNDTSGIAAAAAAAADADLVIMVVGSDLSLEVEGHDRLSIAFSDAQLALVAAVAAAAKGPIVVQVHSGGAMDVAPLLANAKVGAVVHAGQPSVQVPGVGDILFGRTPDGRAVAPAGRMSQVWRVHICVHARSRRLLLFSRLSSPRSRLARRLSMPRATWTRSPCSTSACGPAPARGPLAPTLGAATAFIQARPPSPSASG
jgi:hypothetical protein